MTNVKVFLRTASQGRTRLVWYISEYCCRIQ